MKCSGKNCPMQHTYDIGECKIVETCAYATKTPTNADRIRAMSDEELAGFLCGIFEVEEKNAKYISGTTIPEYNDDNVLQWLQQPAEEDHDGHNQID